MANRKITFKIKLGDDLRRWTSEEASITYAEVLNRAGSLFSTPVEDILLRYQDDDGDWVTLACDEDLKEAITISAVMSTTDKVVVRLDVASPKPTTGSAAAFAEESSKKVQELEETVYRLEKEAKKAAKHAEKMAEKMEKDSKDAAKEAKKAAKEAAKAAAKQAEEAARQLKGKLHTDLAPVLAAGLEQVVTALTPRDGHPHEAAMAAMQGLVAQLATPRESEPVVHPGVTCDVSGMSPIVGIRYKKKGCNYDLCEAEYSKLSDADKQAFMRIDSPQAKWRVHHRPCRHAQRPAAKGPKPQARFVEDVNIPENTEILPGTAFTKIWRLRNTGTEPWPIDTKLIQIGGDKFEGDSIADVAPAPAGEEVDVAVSLVAPNMPGRYVSYWRLAEPPSMRKFGQRIWVQVVIVNPDGSVEFEASESEQPIHPGVECDISGQCPIVGVRYHKKGDDYDLCESEFNQLDDASKGLFERIDRPGAVPVDMAPPTDFTPGVVVDELEERHGWSAASIKAVTNSKLVETMEVLQKSLPPPLFDQAARTLEPLFAVPEQCLGQVLQHLEPMVAALAHEPGMLERINTTVQGLIANPEKLAAELAEYQDASPFVDMLHLVGKYECQGYAPEDKNDWHYVRLVASEDGAHLIWQNAAGAMWPLYPTEDKLSYRVGEECPYYHYDGALYHTAMALQIDAHGNVLRLVGPHGEMYERLADEATFTPPSLPVEGAEVFPTDEAPLPEPATLPEPTTPAGSMTAALADLGIAQADLSASMLADLETAVTESEEASEKKATEEARVQAEAEAAELVTKVEEAAAEIGPDRVEVQPCSMADAIAAMGVGEDALSASMLMEIENVVNANAEQAEQAVIKASQKEEAQKKAAEEAAAAEAAAEAARIAEEAARKEEEAARLAEEEARKEAARIAEEAARIAEEEARKEAARKEEEAARIAEEEAAEKAADLEHPPQETDPALTGLVSQLVDMGFDEPTAATALDATNGNVEQAIMLLLSDPPAPPAEETDGTISEDSTEYPPAWNAEWDSLLEELEEMGFSDPVANRAVLSNANGDVKDAVKELVSRERTNRKQQI